MSAMTATVPPNSTQGPVGLTQVSVEFFVKAMDSNSVSCRAQLWPWLQELGNTVSVNFAFLSTVTATNQICNDGPEDCLASKQSLCIGFHGSLSQAVKFADCQARLGTSANQSFASCYKKAGGLDSALIQDCANGYEGRLLLQDSGTKSAALNVTGPCVVAVNQEVLCSFVNGTTSCGTCDLSKMDADTCMHKKVCGLLTPDLRESLWMAQLCRLQWQ